MKTLSNGRIDARQEALRQGPSWSVIRVVFLYRDGETLRYATRPLRLAGALCAPTLLGLECSIGAVGGGPWVDKGADAMTATFSNADRGVDNPDVLDRRGGLSGALVRAGVVLAGPGESEADDALWLGRWRVEGVEVAGGVVTLRGRSLRRDWTNRRLGKSITAEQWPWADVRAVGKTLPLVFGRARGAPLTPVDVGFVSRLAAAVSIWDATIRLEDVSRFPESGFIQVDDEKFFYARKESATHRLTGIVRGYGQTAVGYHAAGTPVREVRNEWLFAVAGHRCRSVSKVQAGGRPAGAFRVLERDLGDGTVATLVGLERFPTRAERSGATTTTCVRREGALPAYEWVVGPRDTLGRDAQGRLETGKALRWQDEEQAACLAGPGARLHARLTSDLSDGAAGGLLRARVVVEYVASPMANRRLRATIGGRGGAILEEPLSGASASENNAGDDPLDPAPRHRRAALSFGDRLSSHPWALFDGGFEVEVFTDDAMPREEVALVSALWLELDAHPCVETPAPWAVTADVEGVFDPHSGALVENPAALLRDVLLQGVGSEAGGAEDHWPIDAESFDLAEARLGGALAPGHAPLVGRTVCRVVDRPVTLAGLVDDLCGDFHCRLMGGDRLRLVVDESTGGPSEFVIGSGCAVALARRSAPGAACAPEEQQVLFGRTWQDEGSGEWGFAASATRWNLKALTGVGTATRPLIHRARWLSAGENNGDDIARGVAMELADHLLDRRLGEWSLWEATLTPEALALEPGDELEFQAPRQNAAGWTGRVTWLALGRDGLIRARTLARTPLTYCWRHDGANHIALSPSGRWLRFQVGGRLTMALDDAGNLCVPPLRADDLPAETLEETVAFRCAPEKRVVAAMWFALGEGPFMILERFTDGSAALSLDRGVDIEEDSSDLPSGPAPTPVWRDDGALCFAVGGQVVARYRADARRLSIGGRLVERL
jgi:hypothetical protein